MTKLLDNYGILIIPFYYEVDDNQWDINKIIKKLTIEDRIKPRTYNCKYLNNNIEEMIYRPGTVYKENNNLNNNVICFPYTVNTNGLKITEHFELSDNPIKIICKDETSPINIMDNSLFLFYSGIGFLNITVRVDTDDAIKFRETMYFLNQAKRSSNVKLCYQDKTENTITIKNLFRKITEGLNTSSSFDKNNVLSFNYMLFEAPEKNSSFDDNRYNLANRISKNFRESYLVNTNREDCYLPFENTLWGFSSNGVVHIENYTENEETNSYISSRQKNPNISERLNEAYLYLFMLRQHQRFYLRSLEEEYAKTLYSSEEENLDEYYEKIEKLYKTGLMAKLKCDFTNPSSMDHINIYDDNIRKHLGIDKNMNHFIETSYELSNYAEIIKNRNTIEKQKVVEVKELERHLELKERELNVLKKDKLVKIGTAIWTSILTANQGPELIEKFIKLPESLVFRFLLIGIIVIATAIPQVNSVSQHNIEITRLETEIEKEKKELDTKRC